MSIKEDMNNYCLNCGKPQCKIGCPFENDIPQFIHEKDLKKSFEIITRKNLIPSITGRICPHEKHCQGKCIRNLSGKPVDIGQTEAYIGDYGIKNNIAIEKENLPNDIINKLKKYRVAIIGGGPCGLICAGFLAKSYANVTIFEKHDHLGGILEHGIPNFRLPKEIREKSIQKIIDLGINVKLNIEFGKDFFINDLQKEFDAIVLAIGANRCVVPNIKGCNLNNVIKANDMIENNNFPDFKDKKVIIYGGGNVAMDSARIINRLGPNNLTIVYRRTRNEMTAEKKEIEQCINEGIKFIFLSNIKKINGTDKIESVELTRNKLVEKPGNSRLSPIEIENSEYFLHTDYVIMATGATTEKQPIEGFKQNSKGYVLIDDNYKTNIDKVYCGGDVSGGIKTVANAGRSGRDIAEILLKTLKYKI